MAWAFFSCVSARYWLIGMAVSALALRCWSRNIAPMTGLLDDQLDDGWIGPHTEDHEKTLGPFWVMVARLTWSTYGALVVSLATWALIA